MYPRCIQGVGVGETKSRGKYARERGLMTADTVRRAAALIGDGTLATRGAEFLDTGTPGLTLRVTRAAGTWYLRTRTKSVRLGSMASLTLPAAREAAARAKRDVDLGVDPRVDLDIFERSLARGATVEHATDVAFAPEVPQQSEEERRREGPWQWHDLVDLFLASKLPTLKAGYGSKYEAYLRGDEFEPLHGRDLAGLQISDLEELRDRVAESRTVSAAARVVAQGKEALSWAWRYHGTRSGLGHERYPWWDRWSIQYAHTPREHTPTVTELVRTLLVAERNLALGATDQRTEPGTLAMLWAIVLTGQRTGALGGTRRAGIIPMPGRPGWQVWTWTGQEMKGGQRAGRPHALPIPPAVLQVLAPFDTRPDSPWLFPSRVEGRHVTPVGMTQFFHRLEGRPKAGKAGSVTQRPSGNLFAANRIRVWTPHDARRSIATFLDDEELGGAGSAILAHSRGRGADEEARIEDITRRVYAKAQRLDVKAKGMEAWVAHVLAAYAQERDAMVRAGLISGSAGASLLP
nr:integrase arm-type DNA-binding domain-containing protein [Methylobacterium sp. 37f]